MVMGVGLLNVEPADWPCAHALKPARIMIRLVTTENTALLLRTGCFNTFFLLQFGFDIYRYIVFMHLYTSFYE